jgi:hypothetical protein
MRCAGLYRDGQDPQQHAAGARLNFRIPQTAGEFDDRPRRISGFGLRRSKAFYLKALAPLDYALVMEVTQEQHGHDPAAGSAPMESPISGSAAKAGWTSRACGDRGEGPCHGGRFP